MKILQSTFYISCQSDCYSGVILSDWQSSVIVNCFKGKGDVLERGHYRGLNLV